MLGTFPNTWTVNGTNPLIVPWTLLGISADLSTIVEYSGDASVIDACVPRMVVTTNCDTAALDVDINKFDCSVTELSLCTHPIDQAAYQYTPMDNGGFDLFPVGQF